MKRSGDYYITVVEDTNLGQIVATATLVIEHKFTHSCAKVCITATCNARSIPIKLIVLNKVFSHNWQIKQN